MVKENENITYSYDELIQVLKEINLILISLHKMGSYYGEKFINEEDKYRREYEKESTRFIDEWGVCQRLALVRRILSEKFDMSLGIDDMDDLEREMDKIRYWLEPGDNP